MSITVYQLQAKALRHNGGCPLHFADKNLHLNPPSKSQIESFTKVCISEAAQQDVKVIYQDVFPTVHVQILHTESLEQLLRAFVAPATLPRPSLLPISAQSADMLDRLADYVGEVVELEPQFAFRLIDILKNRLQ